MNNENKNNFEDKIRKEKEMSMKKKIQFNNIVMNNSKNKSFLAGNSPISQTFNSNEMNKNINACPILQATLMMSKNSNISEKSKSLILHEKRSNLDRNHIKNNLQIGVENVEKSIPSEQNSKNISNGEENEDVATNNRDVLKVTFSFFFLQHRNICLIVFLC